MRLAFGECGFDSDTRELTRGGRAVHVSPKAFRLLELLLKSRPRALSKSDLKDAIWPDTFVVETNLANLVAELRRALGESGSRDGFVRTVHGFGYAFSGEALPEDPKVRNGSMSGVALVADERTFALTNGENVLGRDPSAEVFLDDTAVSRRHARITVSGSHATLEDLGSKNGTFLGGKSVTAPALLRDADAILLGSVLLTVRLADPRRSTRTLRGSESKRAR
ncbi:MAG: FHA domain-containing protein [Thermoanaerobaculia bacterium]|nr:FHA domain-containing protein [Thermoanaerobaculia bacterium]